MSEGWEACKLHHLVVIVPHPAIIDVRVFLHKLVCMPHISVTWSFSFMMVSKLILLHLCSLRLAWSTYILLRVWILLLSLIKFLSSLLFPSSLVNKEMWIKQEPRFLWNHQEFTKSCFCSRMIILQSFLIWGITCQGFLHEGGVIACIWHRNFEFNEK